MTRPASALLVAGLRPTEPAPAERAESTAPLAWEVRRESVSVQTADGSELRDLHAVYVEGDRRGYQATQADAETIARTLANDPAPSTFGTEPDASIPSAVERIVADGHGSEWPKCERADCDLHVCRPGKAQCNHVDCPEAGPVARLVGLTARDPLAREQTRHAITRDAHHGLVSALRELLTGLEGDAEACDALPGVRLMQPEYRPGRAYRRCIENLSGIIAGHTGTLPDDDREVLADSPAPGLEVAR